MLIFTFSGTAVLLGLGGLCLLIGLTVLVLRRSLRAGAPDGKRTKNAVFRFSTPLHGLSLCVAIAASIIAINWTEFGQQSALKAVQAINEEGARFKPGIQGGRPVRVRFNLPVKFRLQ